MRKKRRVFNISMSAQERRRCLLGLIFMAPFFTLLCIFKFYPIFQCVFQSFFQYQLNDLPGTFVGFSNYKAVLSSELFGTYFYNTIVLYVLNLLFNFTTTFFQALMLFQLTKTRKLGRYFYIFPTGVTALASISIWKYIWDPEAGLANFITSRLGLGTFDWLYSEELVKFCIRFQGLLGGGMMVVIYLVTMNNIPVEQFEAAKMDGANGWQLMRYITIPGFKHMVYIQLLLSLTGSLLAFGDVYMMTQGGPGFASTTLVLGAYNKAFREQNFGQAMAMSVIILIFSLIITGVVNHIMTRKED